MINGLDYRGIHLGNCATPRLALPDRLWALLLWCAVILLQSLYGLGLASTLLFLGITLWICMYAKHLRAALLCAAFYVPLQSLDVPSPFVILFALVTLSTIAKCWSSIARPHVLVWYYTAFLFLSLIAVVYSPNEQALAKFWIYFQSLLFLVILTTLLDSVEDLLCLAICITILGAVSTMIAWLHQAFGQEYTYLGNKVLSAVGEVALLGKTTISNVDETRRYVWMGGDPNFVGSALLLSFITGAGLAAGQRYRHHWPLLLCSLLTSLGILGTYSRSSMIGAILGLMFLIGIQRRLPVRYLLLGAGVSLLAMTYESSLMDRILSIERNLRETGGTGRLAHMSTGLAYWAESPFGHGLGSVAVDLPSEYGLVAGGTTHSTYLDILAEVGIQGLLLFVLLLGTTLHRFQKRIRYQSVKHHAACCGFYAAAISVFIHAATIPIADFKVLLIPVALGTVSAAADSGTKRHVHA